MKPEQENHIMIVDWLRKCHHSLPFWHTANERKTTLRQGALLKKMGVLPGVSDFFFPRGNEFYKGLVLELKIKPNKPTTKQIEFINMMINEGYKANVCYGFNDAISLIKNFYNL